MKYTLPNWETLTSDSSNAGRSLEQQSGVPNWKSPGNVSTPQSET